MDNFSINLDRVPSQRLSCDLGGQSCVITLQQKEANMFVDLIVNDTPIFYAALAQDRRGLVKYRYYGFVGELFFVDTAGNANPDWRGLGERWQLIWGDPSSVV